MTTDPSTEALLNTVLEAFKRGTQPHIGWEDFSDGNRAAYALAARLSQAEEERKKAQGGWDACAELLEAAGSDYQRAAARLSQAEEALDLALDELRTVRDFVRGSNASYVFSRVEEAWLAASSAGETPE